MGGGGLATEGGMVRGGKSRVWGGGVTRAELQTERNGGDSLLATTDNTVRQQYRATFCALKPNAQQLQTSL